MTGPPREYYGPCCAAMHASDHTFSIAPVRSFWYSPNMRLNKSSVAWWLQRSTPKKSSWRNHICIRYSRVWSSMIEKLLSDWAITAVVLIELGTPSPTRNKAQTSQLYIPYIQVEHKTARERAAQNRTKSGTSTTGTNNNEYRRLSATYFTLIYWRMRSSYFRK